MRKLMNSELEHTLLWLNVLTKLEVEGNATVNPVALRSFAQRLLDSTEPNLRSGKRRRETASSGR